MASEGVPEMTGKSTEAASWEIVSFGVQEILADGDWMVVLSQVACRSRGAGKVARSPKADVYRFRDGKVVEFLEFFDTAALAATQRMNPSEPIR
jgi:ketosteroid isomerase-like protein